uniref:p0648C09.10 protein n=1 Tax=Oryza sativa subsp. japonica TaxID=39947 RepID=Q8RYZ0_ORYSJ|nr:P0648C09.10 [Oryza sativa Japonica Group]
MSGSPPAAAAAAEIALASWANKLERDRVATRRWEGPAIAKPATIWGPPIRRRSTATAVQTAVRTPDSPSRPRRGHGRSATRRMPRLHSLVLVSPANACRIAAVNHARRIGNQKTRTPTLPRCPHAIRRVWFMLRAAAAAAASVLRQFNTMPDLCNVQRAYEQIQCYVV